MKEVEFKSYFIRIDSPFQITSLNNIKIIELSKFTALINQQIKKILEILQNTIKIVFRIN